MNLITTNQQLLDFCEPLIKSETPLAIGIDTEFLREHTYWPKLCLLQITSPFLSPDQAVLVDPLSKIDLAPFKALIDAPHITKVIHSGRQDLEVFWHEWHTLPQNYFDTQLAAMVCGSGEGMGYSNLVKLLFEIDLDKDSQFTNWARRPLTQKQLNYALTDVIHLLPAYEILREKLTQLNRWGWMEEDLSILLNPSTYQPDPEQVWLRIHTHRHKPQNLAYMQDVCAWREINAIRLNVNRGRLLRDECIIKIGLNWPQTLDELTILADSAILTSDLALELFNLCQAAFQKSNELWPEATKKTVLATPVRQRLSKLREKLNSIATELNVPARLIGPKADLIALAQGKLENNRIMTGWRYDVFGKYVDEILHA